MSAGKKPNEISIVREYDAPVEAVWEAWTDPSQVAQWWGPRGFTITTHSKDLRPGGHWIYTMHGPDGTDWENRTTYFEVEKHSKLVYDHGANEQQGPLFRVTVNFLNLGERTRMEMTMALETPEAAIETKKFIKKAGGNATWDRLGEYLNKEGKGRETFVIARTFSAPIGLVFDMWTKPEHFSRWLPPTGSTMEFLRADIREGGECFYSMTAAAGFTMYGSIDYVKIEKPNRLVYLQRFTDADGKISRHPLVPVWPETMQTTVTFTKDSPEETTVSVQWEPYGLVKPEELKVFIEFRGSMTQGWTGSFDKLEEILE